MLDGPVQPVKLVHGHGRDAVHIRSNRIVEALEGISLGAALPTVALVPIVLAFQLAPRCASLTMEGVITQVSEMQTALSGAVAISGTTGKETCRGRSE